MWETAASDGVKLVNSFNLVESIQNLVMDRRTVDVRIRCKDHQPSDGLGAHKVILAAASPSFLAEILQEMEHSPNQDHMVCLHLPCYTSFEVGHIMSLLYYGEVWLSPHSVEVHKSLLNDLQIAVKLGYNSKVNSYQLIDRSAEDITDDLPSIHVKCEPQQITEHVEADNCKTEETVKFEVAKEPPSSLKFDDEALEMQSIASEVTEDSNVDEKSVLMCTETKHCTFVTSSLSRLQSHRLVHHRKRLRKSIWKCPVCSEVDVKNIEQHLVSAHFAQSREQCAFGCDLHFDGKSEDDFIRHFKECHDLEEVMSCDFPDCNYSTKDSSNMTQHLRSHNDERNYECTVCQQKFLSSSHLKVHTRAVHTKEKNHQCDFCEKRFATNWQKKSHTKTNHLKSKKAYHSCSNCQKSFYKYQSLSAHIKSCKFNSPKKEEKTFQVCETCGERLKSGATSLRRHQCVCRTGDVLIRCPTCSKQVLSRSLKSHMQYHKSQEQNKHIMSCLVCNKNFTTTVSLRRHILIHENSKPFKCETCDKTFRQKTALTTHFRTHSGLRVSCECGKLFITKSLLNQHKKTSLECAQR